MLDWNADPAIFTLGSFMPRWYGVSWALAFVMSYIVVKKIFIVEKKTQKDLDTLTITMMISTILGARMGHMLFYDLDVLIEDPMELFAFWHGGLASHGGALGILIGLWIFHKIRPSFHYTWLIDRLAIVAPLAGGFIRLGNFMNSEILGSPTTAAWGVWFMRVDSMPVYRHPAQLYEAIIAFALFGLMWWLYKRPSFSLTPGRLFGVLCITLFTARFFIEFVKEHQSPFEVDLPLSMGQILSIPFVIVGIVVLLRAKPVKR